MIEGSSSKRLRNTRFRGVVSGLEGSVVIERGSDRLQQWTDGYSVGFPRPRQSPSPGTDSPPEQDMLESSGQEQRLCGNALWGSKLPGGSNALGL